MGLEAWLDVRILINCIDRTRQIMALSQDGGAEEIGYHLRIIARNQEKVLLNPRYFFLFLRS